MEKKVSKPTRERLIKLVRLLEQLEKAGKLTVSSAEIQQKTGWTSFTIRRDISSLGIRCASPIGYNTKELSANIKQQLKLGTTEKNCCIVGLGKLGSALADYDGFNKSLFQIIAGFDSNVNRTETLRTSFPLYPTSKMEQVIKNENIEYAILTVPENVAQETATKISLCGIKGIVNYTTAILRVPSSTEVENLSVLDALQNLAVK